MKKKIMWEKWIDPFCSNLSEFYPESIINDIPEEDKEPNFLKEEDSLMKSIPLSAGDLISSNKKHKLIFTPLGIFPMMDHHYVANNFNLWVGSTNFDITEDIALMIEKIEGVETLEIYTRYRFRMCVGKCFDSLDVKMAIEEILCDKEANYKKSINSELSEEIQNIILELKEKNKYWGLLVFPNGQKKIIHANEKDDNFVEEMEFLETINKSCGGVLYSYDE